MVKDMVKGKRDNKISCLEARIPMRMLEEDSSCVQSLVGESPEIVLYSGVGGGLTIRKEMNNWVVDGDVPVMGDSTDIDTLEGFYDASKCVLEDIHPHIFHSGSSADAKRENHLHIRCLFVDKREAIVSAVKMLAEAETTYEGQFK